MPAVGTEKIRLQRLYLFSSSSPFINGDSVALHFHHEFFTTSDIGEIFQLLGEGTVSSSAFEKQIAYRIVESDLWWGKQATGIPNLSPRKE
jgi:hypothetical protein